MDPESEPTKNIEAELIAERELLREVINEQAKLLEARGAVLERVAELGDSVGDVTSALRMEIRTVESELEPFLETIPEAARELIRRALEDSQKHVSEVRGLAKALHELTR